MPYCPQCKHDVDDDLSTCPDCGTALVMGVSLESSVDKDDMDAALLLTADNKLQAEFLIGLNLTQRQFS
jgi:predicted amidophosphoribosyltransferase